MGVLVVEMDLKDWHKDHGAFFCKNVVAINAILFLNRTNVNGATLAVVNPRLGIASRLREAINAISGINEEHAREKTVAAQSIVLKALAKLAYDFAFSFRRPENEDGRLDAFLGGITGIDFSHNNLLLRYFEFDEVERQVKLSGIAAYLPRQKPSVNRDTTSFQDGFMRIGAKHTDNYPVLSDMIRWKLAYAEPAC